MNHLVGQLLARSAGVQLTHIPYRGSAPAMNDLMGGQIVALMESLPTAIGYFSSGRMRPLAVSEAERSPSLPDAPTFREAGFQDVVATNWFGFSAAAGIPPEIAKRWETEIATALQSAQVQGGLRQDRRQARHAGSGRLHRSHPQRTRPLEGGHPCRQHPRGLIDRGVASVSRPCAPREWRSLARSARHRPPAARP